MKRAFAGLLLVASVIGGSVAAPERASAVHALIENSSYCDGTGQSATGEGSLSQLAVHFDAFIPEFISGCATGGLVNFLGTGDAAGASSMLNRTRPFAGSDVPLTAAEKQQIELDSAGLRLRRTVVHQVPLYVNGWAVAYNLSCTSEPVKFRSTVLSLIYSGVVTRWNDSALTLDNPGLANCAQGIKLTRRSDPAGATLIFKDYLSKRTAWWIAYKQPVMNTQWPTLNFACRGLGEDGIAGCIASNPGSIGYVETRVAVENGLRLGRVENASFAFVPPSATACTTAAESAPIPPGTPGTDIDNPLPQGFGPDRFVVAPASPTMSDWSNVSLTDSAAGYPICAFSYAFIFNSWVAGYASNVSAGVARTTADYLWTAVSARAQVHLPALGLGRLPPNAVSVSRAGLESIRFCGC